MGDGDDPRCAQCGGPTDIGLVHCWRCRHASSVERTTEYVRRLADDDGGRPAAGEEQDRAQTQDGRRPMVREQIVRRLRAERGATADWRRPAAEPGPQERRDHGQCAECGAVHHRPAKKGSARRWAAYCSARCNIIAWRRAHRARVKAAGEAREVGDR